MLNDCWASCSLCPSYLHNYTTIIIQTTCLIWRLMNRIHRFCDKSNCRRQIIAKNSHSLLLQDSHCLLFHHVLHSDEYIDALKKMWYFTDNIITTQNWHVTFEGPSLIFFIWSLYLISSASSLAIFFSMDSDRASTCVWTSGMSLCIQADNTALKCRLCASMCGVFMRGTKQGSPQRYYGLWFINTLRVLYI